MLKLYYQMTFMTNINPIFCDILPLLHQSIFKIYLFYMNQNMNATTCLDPCQISNIYLFAEITYSWKSWTIFAWSFILDIWQGFKYASCHSIQVSQECILRILIKLNKKWTGSLRMSFHLIIVLNGERQWLV